MREAYDTVVVAWSQRQAALLRRLAAGEKLNETPDWPNIVPDRCPWSLIELLGEDDRPLVT